MTEIYQMLDDGRIVEFRIGRQLDRDEAVWARNLTASEKRTFLKMRDLGYSDIDIYNILNQEVKKKSYAGY